ncbi:cysteine peptidase family C39 domain-containing protein [Thermococcus barossii]|uniref:hypothetical protein n=1 Tax=Thermococcus barossii TaxID=54077 RepID=UPI0012FD8A22|nr:hypothetical protein [Thermococcus barossii]
MTAAPVEKPEAVPLTTVKALAVRELHKFPEFNGALPTNPTPLYFPDGRLAAYEFRMVKNGKTIGYIIVSANRNLPPAILEAGFGKKTPSDLMKELAVKKGVKNYRFVYFSGLNYGLLAEDKVIDMKGKEYRKPNTYKPPVGDNGLQNSHKWLSLKLQTSAHTLMTTDISGQYKPNIATRIDWKMVSGVPRWAQYDPMNLSQENDSHLPQPDVGYAGDDFIGPNPDYWDNKRNDCAPISGAMLIAYYDKQYQTSWYREALIDVLHKLMETDENGMTKTPKIGPGIEKFYDEAMRLYRKGIFDKPPKYRYVTTFKSWGIDGEEDPNNDKLFNVIQSEISNYRPVLLSSSNGDGIGFHWQWLHTTTVTGYSVYSNGDRYIFVHTTRADLLAAWILVDTLGKPRGSNYLIILVHAYQT